MSNFVTRAYRQGTQIYKFSVFTVAAVGTPAHFFFYFIFKDIFGLAENFPIRMIATALCASFFFPEKLPSSIRKHFAIYWHFTLIFVLPFIFTYNLLITDFHELWRYWEIFMVFVLIIYVPNLLAFFIDLTLGMSSAYGLFLLTHPDATLHPEFEVALYIIVLSFTSIAGYFLSFNNLQGALVYQKNDMLRAMAASIAHEMRNPLGQLRHNLSAISHQLPTYSPHQADKSLSQDQLNKLFRLVAQSEMAVTRGVQVIDMILNEVNDRPIDARQFTYLSATRVTVKALDEYGYDATGDRERVSLRASRDFMFRGDETLLVFVLFNLLKNALYYFPSCPQARITIDLESGASGNRLCFRDTGPGIPASELPHLFDGFYTRGKKGGTGLGLAYCKRVMTAFGGDIRCTSVLNEFTEFSLDFPPVPDGAMEADLSALIEEAKPRLAGQRLLVVDDDALMRESVRLHLRPLGVLIDEAEDGEAAVRKAATTDFALILMDLNMPRMNGYEAARRILSATGDDDASRPRIVAHTSEPAYIARPKAGSAGMLALISKPCGQSDLIRQLTTIIDLPRLDHQHAVNAGASHPSPDSLTLLLVDDSQSVRETLALRYEIDGVEVIQADSGEQGLSRLQTQHVDAVLTDIEMPDMDGFHFTQCIRASDRPDIAGLPVIGLSGHGDDTHRELASATGMDAFVVKTDDFDATLALIRGAVRARRAVSKPAFDLDEAARQLGVSTHVLKGQLAGFATEYQDSPERLQTALDKGKRNELAQLAHRLKGGAQLLHADATAAAAEHLERVSRDGAASLATVNAAGQSLIATLHALLAELSSDDERKA